MFIFSIITKSEDWEYWNPTLKEMKKDYIELIEKLKSGKQFKAACGIDGEGKVIKVVVVFDAKKNAQAYDFVKSDCVTSEALQPVTNVKELLHTIKNIIEIVEKREVKEKSVSVLTEDKQAKEEIIMAVNGEETVVKKSSEMVVEEPVVETNGEVEVEEASPVKEVVNGVESKSVVEGMVSNDSKKEVSMKSKLPSVNGFAKNVKLCEKGKYELYMMPMCNAETLIVEGCKFYLVDKETKVPKIGAGHEIKIDKEKIMGATEHNVMNRIKKFEINFTEDDLKCAFERAKEYLEKNGDMVKYSSSMNIQEAYCEVVAFAMTKSAQEESAKVMDGDRKCKYIKDREIVEIKDGYLQDILNEIGAGFTKTVFCKKLCMLQEHYGVEVIIRNTNSRGYSYNKTGNVRYYTFKVVEELISVEGGAA